MAKEASTFSHLLRCFFTALFITPLCVFAPAGVLQFMGFRPTESPIFWIILAAFVPAATATLFLLTRKPDQPSLEGLEKNISEALERGFEGGFRALGNCLLGVFLIGVALFIGAGLIGLLVFGIRQLF